MHTMAKLTPLLACFVALLVLTTAFGYSTTITTTVVEEENKGMGCKRQFEQQQQLYHCKMYLTQRSPSEKISLRSFKNLQTEEHLNDCCQQLEKIKEGCRCRNLKRVVQQQQQEEGSYGAQEMEEIVEKAQYLPSKCNLEPQECQLRAVVF
ncbi:2S sulfur-rich seed storage protein 1-like [Olea europaea var. sylvestris]|uniref:2S albumin n=1 Tax=Olea europaea subsp. europaea TaxID=158383 RepID=A0A8S0P8I7_OLEEU|nr:2S sulfur-rich seed storage protein 1-like [Olea europaea var. sylvestris]CAA2934216.1 2S albumin [Olea europaea subsp. europaea]